MKRSSPETVTVAATCFGVSIGVQCRPADAPAVSAQWPVGSRPVDQQEVEFLFDLEPEPQRGDLFSVRRGKSLKASSQPLNSALRTLQKAIQICVAENAKSNVFVHAGVVAWKNHALILPGFSRAGKSTLVWELVQAGAVYYSDEYAVFDKHGFVHPFALPIGLRIDSGERQMIMPDQVGSAPLIPTDVVFVRYHPTAIWNPRLLGKGEAILELIRHCIAIRGNSSLVLPVIKEVSFQARSFVGMRGDAAAFLDWADALN